MVGVTYRGAAVAIAQSDPSEGPIAGSNAFQQSRSFAQGQCALVSTLGMPQVSALGREFSDIPQRLDRRPLIIRRQKRIHCQFEQGRSPLPAGLPGDEPRLMRDMRRLDTPAELGRDPCNERGDITGESDAQRRCNVPL